MNFKFTIIDDIFEYFSSLKEKMSDLSETNYQLGLLHLTNGRVWEALSRFKITTFFWPNNYKASYQYAYCLTLEENIKKAQEILDDILKKHPEYEKAKKLSDEIKNGELDKIIKRYRENLLN